MPPPPPPAPAVRYAPLKGLGKAPGPTVALRLQCAGLGRRVPRHRTRLAPRRSRHRLPAGQHRGPRPLHRWLTGVTPTFWCIGAWGFGWVRHRDGVRGPGGGGGSDVLERPYARRRRGLPPPPWTPPPPLPIFEAASQDFALAPSVPRGFKLQNLWPAFGGDHRGTLGGGGSQPNTPPPPPHLLTHNRTTTATESQSSA